MLAGARKFAFPEGLLDGEPDAVLLCVPAPVVPYFRRFFAQMEMPYIWKARADFERAYPVFAKIEAQMASASCISSLTESIDRLYRLLDSSLNGTQYTVEADVIRPALPAVPPASANAQNSMRAHITRVWQLMENEVAGVTAGPGEGVSGAPALPDNQSTRAVLRRLLAGLDGGGAAPPVDNILLALRGTTPASQSRNVIDSADGNDLVELLDQVETLLSEIRNLLQ